MVDEAVVLPPLRFKVPIWAVLAGGAIGTYARAEALKLFRPPTIKGFCNDVGCGVHGSLSWTSQINWWLILVNTIGVLIAAFLLAGPLRKKDPDDGWRLLIITGLLGGLTSYSSLIANIANVKHWSLFGGVVVTLLALGLGVVAAWLGSLIARLRWAT